MAMIIESETELVDTGVMALAINLALSEPIANRICFANGQDESGRGLKMLLKRAFKRKDVLLLKLIRNIAAQKRAEIKMLFVVCSSYSYVRVVVVAHCSFTVLLEHWAIRTQDYLPDLAQVVANNAGSFDADFQLECLGALLFCVLCVYLRLQRGPAQSARALELSYESAALVVGILANLELSELDYVAVVQEFALLGWIARKLAASLAAQGAAGAAPLAQSHQRQTGAGARARSRAVAAAGVRVRGRRAARGGAPARHALSRRGRRAPRARRRPPQHAHPGAQRYACNTERHLTCTRTCASRALLVGIESYSMRTRTL